MYLNAGASQRAQGRSPGLGGRGTRRRGVAPGAVASLPAGRRRPEAGRTHRTAKHTYRDSLGAAAGSYIYIIWHVWVGLGPEERSVAASSAHNGRTSDCGSTFVGISIWPQRGPCGRMGWSDWVKRRYEKKQFQQVLPTEGDMTDARGRYQAPQRAMDPYSA